MNARGAILGAAREQEAIGRERQCLNELRMAREAVLGLRRAGCRRAIMKLERGHVWLDPRPNAPGTQVEPLAWTLATGEPL